MSDNTLWERSLQGASYEKLTEFATEVPRILSDVSKADADDVTRETGLLLTKKQVIDLRRYEAAGLALPYSEVVWREHAALRQGYGRGLPGSQVRPFA
ncbi:hypothetical protein [Pseudomonas sp. SJZ080]|uniref:hypothetical protein n=1 Tax=Pseudomonas sp. SJZ080 TaxID=2572888 RepID=UPI002115A095|nr:hypothetical protein [Pseudomonas sp. SJZ080]